LNCTFNDKCGSNLNLHISLIYQDLKVNISRENAGWSLLGIGHVTVKDCISVLDFNLQNLFESDYILYPLAHHLQVLEDYGEGFGLRTYLDSEMKPIGALALSCMAVSFSTDPRHRLTRYT
jgi:hypothetical protein